MPFSLGKEMLTVNKFKDVLLENFYLDKDDITVRRMKNCVRKQFKKGDEVSTFKINKRGYKGVHIPGTRHSVQFTHLLCLLRGIDIPEGCVTDHINGNFLDNSRDNIRITTQKVNCRNRSKKSTNTSGVTGVNQDKNGNWIVRQSINGVRVYGGYFKEFDKACLKMQELHQIAIQQDGYTTRHGK